MTTAPSPVGLVHGTKVSVSPALPYPTKSIFRTNVSSRICLYFGNIEAVSHAAASCHQLRPQSRKLHTTAVLALGLHRSKRSSLTLTTQVPNHPRFNPAQKPPAVEQAGSHRSAFAGMFFNVTASLVARAARARHIRPWSSFTSTMLSLGARAARQYWKISRHFALYAISESPMCIWANKNRIGFIPLFICRLTRHCYGQPEILPKIEMFHA